MSAENWLRDLRYAFRQLARSPGFTAVAVLTLALGIGANAAIFGAIDAVLLQALPYHDPDRVLTLRQKDLRNSAARLADASPANFLDWRERSRSFSSLAAAEPYSHDYLGPEGPVEFRSWLVTDGFFDVLGVTPLMGRTLRPDDHVSGAPAVVVLSHAFWQREFGGNPDLVGQALPLEGQLTTVVGIMPPGFEFPVGRDIWLPKQIEAQDRQNRVATFWPVAGRLAPGVTIAAAQAELDAIAAQLRAEYPRVNADVGVELTPLAEHLVGYARPALLALFGAVGVVLLIACVNVTNLLLARAANRRREFAIRRALGADRARLLRQLLAESALLAGLGTIVGLAAAAWAFDALQAAYPDSVPRAEGIGVDGRVAAFASALAIGTALLVGIAPALQSARAPVANQLHAAAQTAPGARRFRAGLVVAELALATVLLVGAGLLVRSFAALIAVEPGYRTDNVLDLAVQAWRYYPDLAQRRLFVEQTLERIEALPGVAAAGVSSTLPLAEPIGTEAATFTIVGRAMAADERITVHSSTIAGDYFDVLGIPLLSGRRFAATDVADAPPVVLINETMAARYWPGEDPVGQRIQLFVNATPRTAEVVGVVGDVRLRSLRSQPQPSLFVPHAQNTTGALHFTVRSATDDPLALTRAVQREIWAMNSAMPIARTTTLEGLLADSLRDRRFTLALTLGFSLAALALAALGTYGVLSYESSRRAREIGVRMALGAPRARVLGLVVGDGLKLSLLGVGIGVLGALALSRVLTDFLYAVSPFDVFTYLGIAALLLSVTVLASYWPARRAASADPTLALRAE
jgi:putative ABC transport system permease protein